MAHRPVNTPQILWAAGHGARGQPPIASDGLMALIDLPSLLRTDPALAQVLGRSRAILAVPDPARALVFAGLSTLSRRRPIVVAVPTTADAERLAHDLGAFLGDDAVGCSRRGRRCRSSGSAPASRRWAAGCGRMWRLRDPDRGAPRSSSRRCGRWCSGWARTSRTSSRVVVGHGEQLDPTSSSRALVGAGYRREEPGRAPGRGRRARLDRRRVPVHRRRAGAHRPLGRRGRPAHRVLGRPTSARRSTVDRGRDLPVPRAAARPTRCGARAERWSRAEPWGREQWERLAEGQTFDGMESWLPWLVDGRARPVRPARRRRAGAARRAAAHARPGRRPAGRGGRPRRARSPGRGARSTTPTSGGVPAAARRRSTGCWRTPTSPAWTVTVAPEGPRRRHGRRPWAGPGGRRRRRARGASSRELLADGYRVVVARRRRRARADARLRRPARRRARRSTPDGSSWRPLERGFILPAIKLAVLAEADVTGRRRAHRRAAPAAARRRTASSTT